MHEPVLPPVYHDEVGGLRGVAVVVDPFFAAVVRLLLEVRLRMLPVAVVAARLLVALLGWSDDKIST